MIRPDIDQKYNDAAASPLIIQYTLTIQKTLSLILCFCKLLTNVFSIIPIVFPQCSATTRTHIAVQSYSL